MKTHYFSLRGIPVLVAACAIVFQCLACPAFAGDAPRKAKATGKSAVKAKAPSAKATVTGSRIPETTTRGDSTVLPATASPLTVLDQKAIQRSGHVTVAGVLGAQPAFR